MLNHYSSKDELGRGSSLIHAGYNSLAGSPNLNNRSMTKVPVKNVYMSSKGRHGFNPNAVKDYSYMQQSYS